MTSDSQVAGPRTARPPAPSRLPGRRQAPRPRPAAVDALAGLAGLGFGAVLAAVVATESRGALAAPGGLMMAVGRFAGFSGTYLLLIMVVLVARLPVLESSVGQDRLVRWHRQVATWAISLIVVHVITITIGYAQAANYAILPELLVLITSYRDVLAAVVGFGLLVMASVTSYRYVRRRMRYETWWVVHLYLYLALALAFAHQIYTGVPFIGHPLVQALWAIVWAATAGLVLAFRVLLPVWRSLRHRLVVVEVRREAPGVVSVICQGRHLDKLAISGGQFFFWRFLTRDQWWQAHPYSLSALPQPPYLRVTVKAAGDHSGALAHVRPGTRVAIEGPYGAFTDHVRSSDGVLLIGAGVGITPLRALLEDLPPGADVVVLVRASTRDDLVHQAEIAALVRQRGGRLHEIVGSRSKVRFSPHLLHRLVPDLRERDIYICGPEAFSSAVNDAAARLGAVPEQVHQESFGF
jgi:predicted ferric reductase